MQFYMISVLFFHVFIVNNWRKCPRGWGFSSFYRPGGGSFSTLFCPGDGEFAHQKNCPGEGWSGLELTDTLPQRGLAYKALTGYFRTFSTTVHLLETQGKTSKELASCPI